MVTLAEPITYDEDKDIYVAQVLSRGKTKEETFKRLIGAVAWGDSRSSDFDVSQHAAILGGELLDGTLAILSEFQGPFHFQEPTYLLKTLIDWKDNFLVSTYYVEPDPVTLFRGLRDTDYNGFCDGLTEYAIAGYDSLDQPLYRHRPGWWPHFRNRNTVATLQLVPPEVLSDFRGAIGTVNTLISADKIAVVKTSCPQTNHWSKEPPRDAYDNSLFRAYIWLVACWHRYKTPVPIVGTSPKIDNARWW